MADLTTVLIFVISILLLAIILFLADKLIGDKPDKLTGGYLLKAILTALVIIVVIIGVSYVVSQVDILGIGRITTILAFVLSCYVIKFLLLNRSGFETAVWVGVITWLFVYILNYLAETLFHQSLIIVIG